MTKVDREDYHRRIQKQLDCSPKSFVTDVYREYQAYALRAGIRFLEYSWSHGHCLWIHSLRASEADGGCSCTNDEVGRRFVRWIEHMKKNNMNNIGHRRQNEN